jgi:hypothetical protein
MIERMDTALAIGVCLALWWIGFSLLVLRDRAQDEKVQLTPEEKEDVKQLEAELRVQSSGQELFSKAAFGEFVRTARTEPSIILRVPVVLFVYGAIAFLIWPVFVIFRNHRNRYM